LLNTAWATKIQASGLTSGLLRCSWQATKIEDEIFPVRADGRLGQGSTGCGFNLELKSSVGGIEPDGSKSSPKHRHLLWALTQNSIHITDQAAAPSGSRAGLRHNPGIRTKAYNNNLNVGSLPLQLQRHLSRRARLNRHRNHEGRDGSNKTTAQAQHN
jgi:hypothetical protein